MPFAPLQSPQSPQSPQCVRHAGARRNSHRALPLLLAGGVLLAVLALAACGTGSPADTTAENPPPPATETSTTPVANATATPDTTPQPAQQVRYAYLYSRVDYPLQIPVAQDDTVTLTLSPHEKILTVAPRQGTGSMTVGAPIYLPADLEHYQDVAAEAAVSGQGGPVTWQLVSAPRQSLLASDHSYAETVTFGWRVHAVADGQNTQKIVLSVYYVYLDGSQHAGTVEVTDAPIPMVAVATTPFNSLLPPLKVPLVGLSGLAGILTFARFIYGLVKWIDDAVAPVRDAAGVAVAIKGRIAPPPRRDPPPQPPTR